jgi:hypothetical protein
MRSLTVSAPYQDRSEQESDPRCDQQSYEGLIARELLYFIDSLAIKVLGLPSGLTGAALRLGAGVPC